MLKLTYFDVRGMLVAHVCAHARADDPESRMWGVKLGRGEAILLMLVDANVSFELDIITNDVPRLFIVNRVHTNRT